MKIKLYDKSFTALTTLLITGTGVSDFNNLEYRSAVSEIGEASFIMRLDNAKATDVNLRHYNRVEIVDDDDTVRWVGLIVRKRVRLNQVEVRCYTLEYILDKRVTGADEAQVGNANTRVTALLSAVNSAEDTGISAGTIDLTTSIDITFNRNSVYRAIDSVARAAGGQFHVDLNRNLNFRSQVGVDLSSTILFQYDVDLIDAANIVEFNVDDIGTEIATKSYGISDVLSSSKENATLKTKFGLLENFANFVEPNDQATLDGLTDLENRDEEFSPSITLLPDVIDNFEAGDTITIKLKNKLIDVDGTFQVLEKIVMFKGGIKQVSIRISALTTDLLRQIREIKQSADLANRSI